MSGLSRIRQILALVLRAAIMLLLVLALAQLQMVRVSEDLCVYFLLDQSQSIPPDLRSQSFDYLKYAASPSDSNRRTDDHAGLIAFAANAGIEVSPVPVLQVRNIYTVLNPAATDLAGAIRLATAAFPEDSLKRIVLITDGNENRGSAVAEAQNARANGVVIDVLPLEYARGAEVLVDKVIIPPDVLPEEEFEIKIVVQSFQNTRAKLHLFQNSQLIANQPVELFADRPNVFTVTRTLDDPDFYTFEARIECDDDTISKNNVGHGFVDVRGDPKILFISGDDSGDDFLPGALRAEGLHVAQGGLGDIPVSPEEIQRWDLLLLSNVPASAMTGGKNSQMALIRDSVKNSGIGLVMIGGVNTFGAGGYKGTEIEEALPVDMDVSQKKVLPSGALVLVMDAIDDPSVPNGNAWSREIAKAALDGISTRDKFGIVATYTNEWFIPLTVASDKAAIRAKIKSMSPMDCAPDGGINMAAAALKNTEAGVKHVVVISDSGCGTQIGPTLTDMVKNKITVTAVCIGPHQTGMLENMEFIARMGAGNFYYVKNPETLPQIFFKEASIVQKSLIWNETFQPQMDYSTSPLSGISPSDIPPLKGYVLTSRKASNLVEMPIVARQKDTNDPIFAHWRYGLGKAVAFTSDAKNAWGQPWVNWLGYSRLWAQTARWCMRPQSGWDYDVQARVEGSQGRVVIDAVNENGEFVNFLEVAGNVSSPDIKSQEIQLSQTGPGRYEGDFKADQDGTYIVNLFDKANKEAAPHRIGVSVSYSAEYREFETNHTLLKRIAETTGGRILATSDSVFEHNLPPVRVSKPIWPLLLLVALCLFPLDVFVRRVMVDYERLMEALQRLVSKVPVLGRAWQGRPERSKESMDRLLQRKRQVQEAISPRGAPSPLAQSLDKASGESQETSAASSPAAEPSPSPSSEPSPSSYTERLLAAKKRAMKRKP